MDYKVLSVQLALEAMRRGASQNLAVAMAQEVTDRLLEMPEPPDLILVLMNIENVFRSYGYPAT